MRANPVLTLALSLVLSLALALTLALALAPPAHAQSEASLQRCSQIAEPVARLACYDAIARPAAAARVPPEPAVPAAAPAPANTAPPPASRAAAAPTERVETFGLPEAARGTQLQSIETAVADDFSGWGPNDKIRLANGQVWEVTDQSSGAVRQGSRKVLVRRGALGSFFLEFEGMNKSPRVRRLQ